MKHLDLELEVLSPVHVGTGDSLDPMSYLMREEDGTPYCYTVDTAAWIGHHPDPEGLAERFAKSELPAIRAMVAQELDPRAFGTARSKVASRDVFETYRKEMASQASRTSLLIGPNLRNQANQAPLVPGSSLKGAMRTAVIDYLDQEQGLGLKAAARRGKNGYTKALQRALGSIQDDAFKMLKVGDFEAPVDTSLVVRAQEISLNPDKQATPKAPCEVLASMCLSGSGNSFAWHLYGRASLGDHQSELLVINQGHFRASWDWNALADLVSRFYLSRYEKEISKFYSSGIHHDTGDYLRKVLGPVIEARSQGEMFLRVGHYSHIECMTITDNNPQSSKGYGKTRTLADGFYPFGWVKLSPCPGERHQEGTARKRKHDQRQIEARLALRNQAARELEERRRQQEELKEAQRRAEEEGAKREAELEAMPPDERHLKQLQDGQLSEQDMVVKLYRRLDEMEEDLRKRVALALKDYWQEHGKWGKKKKHNKRQQLKVQKIKEILGE